MLDERPLNVRPGPGAATKRWSDMGFYLPGPSKGKVDHLIATHGAERVSRLPDAFHDIKLVEDGLQSADPRRLWVAVFCDRAFQISYEGELFFVGKAWRRASAPSQPPCAAVGSRPEFRAERISAGCSSTPTTSPLRPPP